MCEILEKREGSVVMKCACGIDLTVDTRGGIVKVFFIFLFFFVNLETLIIVFF